MSTWLKFLWWPRTPTADKQSSHREGPPLMCSGWLRPLFALQHDDHNTDVISCCKAESALAFDRAVVREDSLPLKPYWWNPEQKKIWSRVNERRSWPISAQLEAVSSGTAAVTMCSHCHGQQFWEMGKCQNNLWIRKDWSPNCDWMIQHPLNIETQTHTRSQTHLIPE